MSTPMEPEDPQPQPQPPARYSHPGPSNPPWLSPQRRIRHTPLPAPRRRRLPGSGNVKPPALLAGAGALAALMGYFTLPYVSVTAAIGLTGASVASVAGILTFVPVLALVALGAALLMVANVR